MIEDEPTIATSVAARLRKEGFEVDLAEDGPSGVDRCRELRPDLVILDVMLPGLDGMEVCREIQRGYQVPVLMLTALDSEADLLVGLGVGADDYMTKPFSPRELVARVKTLLRRVERQAPVEGTVVVGVLEIDPASRRVWRAGEEVGLTRTEFDLLVALAERPGEVRSRDWLLSRVWGYRDASGARTVDSHIRAVRRKLGSETIRTVHGVGYSLEVPDR